MLSKVAELVRCSKRPFHCVDPTTSKSNSKQSLTSMDCCSRALSASRTTAAPWISLYKELLGKDISFNAAGMDYNYQTAAVEAVRADGNSPAAWLALATSQPYMVEVWPDEKFNELQCYCNALQCPPERVDCVTKATVWQAFGQYLEYRWEDFDEKTTIVVGDRTVGIVECFVESVRSFEGSSTLLSLALAMRGIVRMSNMHYCFARQPYMPLVDHVEVLPGRRWTALQCVARSLRGESANGVTSWYTAAVIQFIDEDDSDERLVLNGQSYDMMQCLVKSWLADPRPDREKTIELTAALSTQFNRFKNLNNVPDVAVDGETYHLEVDPYRGYARRWVEVNITN